LRPLFPAALAQPDRTAFGERARSGFDEVARSGFGEVTRQLTEYLDGSRRDFELPVAARGTAFDQRVWELVSAVPYGETTTYGELARAVGGGTDPRDVGTALGRNPVCVVIPCHRVLGSTGKLTGYAGGLERKRTLLSLERAGVQPASAATLF
jgi:methylated-DNA-[protein]-cysteine S-methyltransferase